MPDTRRASGTFMRVVSAVLEAEETARPGAAVAEPRLPKVPAVEGAKGVAEWPPATEAGGRQLSCVCGTVATGQADEREAEMTNAAGVFIRALLARYAVPRKAG
jgi:hypothetical protein